MGGSYLTGASAASSSDTKIPASGRGSSLPTEMFNSLGTRLQLYLNVTEKTIEQKIQLSDGSWSDSKKVNTPKMVDGMIPVKWNGKNWLVCNSDDPEWYSYDGSSNNWANVMLSDGIYTSENVSIGQVLNESALGSMFVWIPRYAYNITSDYHTNKAGKLEAKFLKGTTNEASDGTTSWDNISGENKWNIHPAFTSNVDLGGWDSELPGIWVGKFQASRSDATSSLVGSSNTLTIRPNVKIWVNSTIGENYSNSLNMFKKANSHLMKNSEWGAVVYLTYSKYGLNKSGVDINNNSSYITGGGNYTKNTKQSTTKNVFGIYDMAGGAMEMVASYIANGHSNLSTYGWNEITTTATESSIGLSTKYATVYDSYEYNTINDTMESNYLKSANKYGDAIYEISSSSSLTSLNSWLKNSSRYLYSSYPFFQRGGDYGYTNGGGMFSFYYTSGNETSNSLSGFRPVLAP